LLAKSEGDFLERREHSAGQGVIFQIDLTAPEPPGLGDETPTDRVSPGGFPTNSEGEEASPC